MMLYNDWVTESLQLPGHAVAFQDRRYFLCGRLELRVFDHQRGLGGKERRQFGLRIRDYLPIDVGQQHAARNARLHHNGYSQHGLVLSGEDPFGPGRSGSPSRSRM